MGVTLSPRLGHSVQFLVCSSWDGLLGDTSTHATGGAQGLSWFLCKTAMDAQSRTF